jgi:eukaryotic-like serine/threonine-protein kinase
MSRGLGHGMGLANQTGIMIAIGQTVGNYRVTEKLGEGAMGVVFLAEHPVIGRKAALKVIHPQHARNAEVVSRFVNEARVLNEIGHEHIVQVTDFGRTERGDFYFIMEYLDGEPLSEWILREGPAAPTRALAIAAQIADALDASHRHGIIHRDLKPENVFIVPRGGSFVKVLDFGLAKLLHGHTAYETLTGTIMGTPCYMAPEQCSGRGMIDERTDVYALGVVLFEMLTGRVPFGGESHGEVLNGHINKRPPAPSSVVSSLSPVLDALVLRALAKDPAKRFSSMANFRAALLALGLDPVAGKTPSHRSLPAMSTIRESTAEVPPVAHDGDDRPLRPARNRRPAVAIVLAAAVGGLALATAFTHSQATGQLPTFMASLVSSPSIAATVETIPDVPEAGAASTPDGAIDELPRPPEPVAVAPVANTDDDPPPSLPVAARPRPRHHHRATTPAPVPARASEPAHGEGPDDGDDVLAPSFLTEGQSLR